MIQLLKNKILASFIGIFVISILTLAPFSPTFQYQIVEAKPGDATEITQKLNNAELGILNGTALGNALSNSISAFATNVLMIKEVTLDGIAWGIINIILQEMIREITAWVNAGFPDGGPAFVQDFGGFLRRIADGLVGDFILGSPLGFVCSPFKLDIQLALSAQYLFGRELETTGYQPKCTLSGIMQNINNFTVDFDGTVDLEAAQNPSNFAAGGWAWWLGSTKAQENNVYGAYAEAQAALSIKLSNAKGEEIEILKWNKGFLNLTKCDPPGSKKNCKTVTPGTVIEAQLNKALGGGQDRLTIADEINELIAALLAQLAQKVMGGIAGLFGSTQSIGGAPSFFDDLAEDVASTTSVSLGATARATAEEYIEANERVIAVYESLVDTLDALDGSPTSTVRALVLDHPIPDLVINEYDTALDEIATTTRQLSLLDSLIDDFDNEDDTQARLDILEDISALQNEMPRSSDVTTVNNMVDTINTAFNEAIYDWYIDIIADLTALGESVEGYDIPARYIPEP